MSHLTRVRTTWYRGYITTGTNMRDLDQNTFLAINGDDGGTYAPAAPIWLSGNEDNSNYVMMFTAPSQVSGGTSVVQTRPDVPMIFGNGTSTDYFGLAPLHPGRTLFLPKLCTEIYSLQPGTDFVVNNIEGNAQALVQGAFLAFPLRVCSGGTLESVEFYFQVSEPRGTSAPDQLTRFRVVAVGSDGTVIPLRVVHNESADAATDINGWQEFPRAASSPGLIWFNLGIPQRFVYVCDLNHVIDNSKYSYFAQVQEEQGANSWATLGNLYLSTNTKCTNISILSGRT